MRIGIIGGGPAGLAAAHFLKEKGYTQVTVLERASYLGGKCESLQHQGRSIDLGGDFITAEYKDIYRLAKQLGMQMRHVPKRHSVDMQTGRYECTLRAVTKGVNPLMMFWGTLRYAWCIIKYRRLAHPGYDGLGPDTMQPFGQWLEANGMSGLHKFFTIAINVFGYGINYNDLPAAYVLRFVGWTNFWLMMRMGIGAAWRWPKHFNMGFQHFWERLAWNMDVELNCDITAIRRGQTVEIDTAKGTSYEFDRIIVACPFDQIAKVMDTSDTEQALFDQIVYNDYYSACCTLDPMPKGLEKRGTVDIMPITPAGHPWAMVRAWPDRNAVLFFCTAETSVRPENLAPKEQRDKEIVDKIRGDVEKLGGKVDEVLALRRWLYFPHVSAAAMRDGFYDRLEGLQGTNNTFYSWSLMNFETVHHVTKYSKHLVAKHFSGPTQ